MNNSTMREDEVIPNLFRVTSMETDGRKRIEQPYNDEYYQ